MHSKKTLTVIFTYGSGLKQVQTFHLMAGNSAMARFIQYYTQSGPPYIIGRFPNLWSGSFNLYSLMKQRSCQTVKPHLPSPLRFPSISTIQYLPSFKRFHQVIEEGAWKGLETPHINGDQVEERTQCTLIFSCGGLSQFHLFQWPVFIIHDEFISFSSQPSRATF